MGTDLVLVGPSYHLCFLECLRRFPGWYDCGYDEELGCKPCIFTSVTPVCNGIVVLAVNLSI